MTLQEKLDEHFEMGQKAGISLAARNFLNLGFAPQQVAQGTGLSLADVKKLRQ